MYYYPSSNDPRLRRPSLYQYNPSSYCPPNSFLNINPTAFAPNTNAYVLNATNVMATTATAPYNNAPTHTRNTPSPSNTSIEIEIVTQDNGEVSNDGNGRSSQTTTERTIRLKLALPISSASTIIKSLNVRFQHHAQQTHEQQPVPCPSSQPSSLPHDSHAQHRNMWQQQQKQKQNQCHLQVPTSSAGPPEQVVSSLSPPYSPSVPSTVHSSSSSHQVTTPSRKTKKRRTISDVDIDIDDDDDDDAIVHVIATSSLSSSSSSSMSNKRARNQRRG
jgi:hypothetical protein